ncbi:MAG: polysaccharide deacetylase family protein [Holosporales bacterium]|jgi:peptidoglycan/xylan/chitin deacetylase (PgdA/CDA1 family)|nr:polysaccharide deacetylase family protein [Holosporales bacterium]
MKWKSIFFVALFLSSCTTGAKLEKVRHPKLLLTFDDFPGQLEGNPNIQRDINEKIIEILKQHDAKAMVFANTGRIMNDITKGKATLRLWLRNGHKVGNHTYTHPVLSNVSPFEYKLDIINGEPILKDVLYEFDQKLTYFRYPYLDYGKGEVKDDIASFLELRGYEVIGITVDSMDWRYNSKMYKGDLKARRNYIEYAKAQLDKTFGNNKKDIMLFHVNSINTMCLDEILTYAKSIGYSFSTSPGEGSKSHLQSTKKVGLS